MVYRRRREVTLPASFRARAQSPLWQKDLRRNGRAAGCQPLRRDSENRNGVRPEMPRFASVPVRNHPELSDSLVDRAVWLTRPAKFWNCVANGSACRSDSANDSLHPASGVNTKVRTREHSLRSGDATDAEKASCVARPMNGPEALRDAVLAFADHSGVFDHDEERWCRGCNPVHWVEISRLSRSDPTCFGAAKAAGRGDLCHVPRSQPASVPCIHQRATSKLTDVSAGFTARIVLKKWRLRGTWAAPLSIL